MFRTLIVGVDGRAGGTDALALARRLAAPDARIVVLHAFPARHADLLRDDAMKVLGKEEIDERCDLWPVPDASPARALHRAAESEQADLIVIGACHRGPASRAVAGDVTRNALHGAPCAVAVAPPGTSAHAKLVRNVGVGVDGGRPSEAALAFAVRVAAEHDATLRLFTAVSAPVAFAPSYAYTYDWSGLLDEDRRAAREMLEGFAKDLDLSTVVDVEVGPASEQLVGLSKAVDLLIVGSRGWGTFRRVVLGSTADHLVHHASCPVIVVPAPSEE